MMDLLLGTEIFKEENDVFIHNGRMNDSFTAPIIDLNSESIGTNKRLHKRLSYFTIECFQNVIRHGEQLIDGDGKLTKGMFVYANKKDSIRVCTSNEVKFKDAVNFEDKLSKLKSLSQEELRLLYEETLKTTEISSSGGAGLGLIDILRKTKSNVNFKFVPKANGYSNFLLETVLDNGDCNGATSTEDFQNFMEINNLILFRKGSITKMGLLPICKLIGLELQVNKVQNHKCFLFAILELVQNVCEHTLVEKSDNDCLFLQKNEDDCFDFYTGNVVSNPISKEIISILDRVNAYTEEELQNEYEKLLSFSILKASNKSELGWVKIRRNLGGLIQYRFEKYDDDHLMFYAGLRTKNK